MFTIIIEALYMSTLVGLASFFLYSWAHKGGHIDADGNLPENDEITLEEIDKETGHFAIDKWISLGGGYYGTVAIVKLVLSEIRQTFSFLQDWDGLIEYFNSFGIGYLVDFFINQFQMFFQAISWPVDYFRSYDSLDLAILFALSYGAYKGAKDYAQKQHQKSQTSI